METKQRVKLHSALFEDKDSADRAYQAALKRGYRASDINVIMSDSTRNKFFPTNTSAADTHLKTETGDKSMEGLAIGGALGGTVLGTIGAIVALSSTIAIPALGLVIAGPLAAGLVGAGAGSITGGLIGALIGAGIPEERAKIYESGIKKGGIVVTVPARDETDELIVEDWKKSRGTNIF